METSGQKSGGTQKRSAPNQPFGAGGARSPRGQKREGAGAPKKRRAPKSLYGQQLEEKQKTKRNYNLSEHQFASYVKKASEKKHADPKTYLYEALETRLDSFVYRIGLSKFSRPLARQMVTHGHITVNGRKLNIPSYQVKMGDIVAIRPRSSDKALFHNVLKYVEEEKIMPPSWIAFDYKKGEGSLKGKPQMEKSEILSDLNSVIEFYSR